MKTKAQQAFEASGLSYEQVARRAEITPGYLKRLLRSGSVCFVTADRLRRALGCPVEYFLPSLNKIKSNKTNSTTDFNSTTERKESRQRA